MHGEAMNFPENKKHRGAGNFRYPADGGPAFRKPWPPSSYRYFAALPVSVICPVELFILPPESGKACALPLSRAWNPCCFLLLKPSARHRAGTSF
ncbi:hypothetical protein CL3_01380 [butyrate-producing bacterium SM4/1]|nr:hypothetical protein CL3_01380 [butyrate-producing bacterium SM4/1]